MPVFALYNTSFREIRALLNGAVAVITAVPFETPITVPSFPTDAILELLLDHFTTFCTFAVLGNIVEVNCIDLGFAVKSSVTLFLFNCIPISFFIVAYA